MFLHSWEVGESVHQTLSSVPGFWCGSLSFPGSPSSAGLRAAACSSQPSAFSLCDAEPVGAPLCTCRVLRCRRPCSLAAGTGIWPGLALAVVGS